MRSRSNVQRRFKDAVAVGMPLAWLLSRRHAEIACAYLGGYVLLDWLSYVHPFGSFGITPWNPQTGLSFALVILLGTEFIPWLFVAPVLADALVRGLALPIPVEIAGAAVIGGGYAATTRVLLNPKVDFDPTLGSKRALFLLIAAAVSSAAVVAAGYAGALAAFGVLPLTDFVRAAIRLWVGDAIGIIVLTPLLVALATRQRLIRPSWEALALLVVTLGALWLVFGFANAFRFQLFYVFFLPVVWVAVRFGLEGVTVGLLISQIGLIAAIYFSDADDSDVTAYQALMLVLSLTGLAVGVIVSEQQRIQQQLRLNQEALSRALRVSTLGEFGAALAHEINQPLTAIANYARVLRGAPDAITATQTSERLIAQVDRAAEVVRRLRDFIRLGRSETSIVAVSRLVHEAESYCHVELERAGVSLQTRIPRDLPPVKVDALQIVQVIVNLVRNASEALSDAGRYDGKVSIEADGSVAGTVTIRVRDNGPGFDADLAERALIAFTTTKSDGMGLGLPLARTIVDAHGGRLWIESNSTGAVVSFTLSTALSPSGQGRAS